MCIYYLLIFHYLLLFNFKISLIFYLSALIEILKSNFIVFSQAIKAIKSVRYRTDIMKIKIFFIIYSV